MATRTGAWEAGGVAERAGVEIGSGLGDVGATGGIARAAGRSGGGGGGGGAEGGTDVGVVMTGAG